MKVSINVIKKDKVYLFLLEEEVANISEYHVRIRNYINSLHPNIPYTIAITDGEPKAVFVIMNVNNDLEQTQISTNI